MLRGEKFELQMEFQDHFLSFFLHVLYMQIIMS